MTETREPYEASVAPPSLLARIEVLISPVEEQLLESIGAYYGHRSEAETVSFLIQQEARRLVRGGQSLMSFHSVVDGYLRNVITAEEAMQFLAVSGGQ